MFAGLPGNPATGVSGIFPTPPTFIWLVRKMPGCLTFRCRKYRLFLQIRRQLNLPRYPASIKILVFPSEFKFVLAVFASMTWFTLPICNTFNQSLIHRNKTLPFCQINLRYLIPLKHPVTVFGCRTTWLDMTSDYRISRCGVVGFYRKHDWNGLLRSLHDKYSLIKPSWAHRTFHSQKYSFPAIVRYLVQFSNSSFNAVLRINHVRLLRKLNLNGDERSFCPARYIPPAKYSKTPHSLESEISKYTQNYCSPSRLMAVESSCGFGTQF